MSNYFYKNNGDHHSSNDHHDGHGHKHISVEEAKEASAALNSALMNIHRARAGTYIVTPVLDVLYGHPGKENFEYWNSDEIKKEVLQCAKELNRFRYCEDNYSAESKNPAQRVEDEAFACTEEQWQATECLIGESPEDAKDIIAFTADVNQASQLLRRLSSHLQIPREWKEVVDEVDPSGLTEPVSGPGSMIQTPTTEKFTNSILKSLFSQEMLDYQRECIKGDSASKRCSRAKNVLSQSWAALQTSRFNAKGQSTNFSDSDAQKGNKIRKWKKANVVGGDRSLRRIEVHPADHWITTLSRKAGKYDWLPEIQAAVEKSLNESREPESAAEDKQ